MRLRPAFVGAALSLAALGLTLAPTPILPAGPAAAQGTARDLLAEQFVQAESRNALAILSNHDMSIAEKSHAFGTFVDRVADVPKVTTFVLGKYARIITPDQHTRFAAVFRQYATKVYETHLNEYRGETFQVTGSVIRRPGDVIVNSVVSGGHLDKPAPVAWRVINSGPGWKVVDVQVAGVWLAITEQQDFVSTVDNAHGDIDVLIAQLQKAVATGNIPGKGK